MTTIGSVENEMKHTEHWTYWTHWTLDFYSFFKNIFLFLPLFLPNFVVSNCCSSYYLVSSLQLPYGLGRDEGWKSCVLRYTTQPAALLLNTARIQPGSQPHQCVGGNAVHLATLVSVHCARPDTGVAAAQWDKDIPTAQALPNPDDARPIVRRPMDLPVAARLRAWARTQSLWWHSWRCSTAPLTTAPPRRPAQYALTNHDVPPPTCAMTSPGLNVSKDYISLIITQCLGLPPIYSHPTLPLSVHYALNLCYHAQKPAPFTLCSERARQPYPYPTLSLCLFVLFLWWCRG